MNFFWIGKSLICFIIFFCFVFFCFVFFCFVFFCFVFFVLKILGDKVLNISFFFFIWQRKNICYNTPIIDYFWRDGRAAYCGGLENRCPPQGPWVQILLPPLRFWLWRGGWVAESGRLLICWGDLFASAGSNPALSAKFLLILYPIFIYFLYSFFSHFLPFISRQI